jgi:hypothetical protein
MKGYFLPPNVHCCRRGNAFVFLHLSKDEYFLVTGEQARALVDMCDAPRGGQPTVNAAALADLLRGGLLTDEPRLGRPFTLTRPTFSTDPLLECESQLPRTRPQDYSNLFIACLSAMWRLRWCGLLSAVDRVYALRSRRSPSENFDLERARQLTAVFKKLRRLFPSNYLCLFDSLALIEFLALYSMYPAWIFGVKLEPWAAHCWVQHEGVTFDEDPEEAASYTQILCI